MFLYYAIPEYDIVTLHTSREMAVMRPLLAFSGCFIPPFFAEYLGAEL